MKSLLDKYVADTFGENHDQSFYDLEISEQDSILAQIRAYGIANKTKFLRELREIDPLEELSPISLIYEAVAMDPDNWADFYPEEIKRVLDFSLTKDKPADALNYLHELVYNLDTADAPHIRAIMKILAQYLETPDAGVRKEVVFLINGILDADNSNHYQNVVSKLIGLLNDPDWRVRSKAFFVLKAAEALPEGYKRSFLDRLRKFLNPLN